MKKMLKLVIDRKTWLKGEGSNKSALLRSDGKMCCLGFLAIKNGASRKSIMEIPEPRDILETKCWGLTRKMRDNDNIHGDMLMIINDRIIMSDESREKQLKEEFEKLGVSVSFKG